MTTALPHTTNPEPKQYDTRKNAAPPSQRTNDQIRKNNARTTPPKTRLKRPQKLPQNDKTQKIRLKYD
jgi:hypothetical protein